jgi:hypothetical protein
MKKIISLMVTLMMMISMTAPVYAADMQKLNASDTQSIVAIDSETTVTLVIPKGIEVDESTATQLLDNDRIQDGDIVTIYEVGSVEQSSVVTRKPSRAASTSGLTGSVKTTLTYGKEYKTSNFFVISVAKGQTTTLAKEFSQTLTTNFAVGNAFVKADIGGSLSVKCSKSEKFKGPEANSKYNSREFRIQCYARRVDWVQKKYNLFNKLVETRSGTAYSPTRYLMYSIDHKI